MTTFRDRLHTSHPFFSSAVPAPASFTASVRPVSPLLTARTHTLQAAVMTVRPFDPCPHASAHSLTGGSGDARPSTSTVHHKSSSHARSHTISSCPTCGIRFPDPLRSHLGISSSFLECARSRTAGKSSLRPRWPLMVFHRIFSTVDGVSRSAPSRHVVCSSEHLACPLVTRRIPDLNYPAHILGLAVLEACLYRSPDHIGLHIPRDKPPRGSERTARPLNPTDAVSQRRSTANKQRAKREREMEAKRTQGLLHSCRCASQSCS